METHKMKLTKTPFDMIANGEKNIESRLYDAKRRKVQVGDHIIFTNLDDVSENVETVVLGLSVCDAFDTLFSQFPANQFGGTSKEHLATSIRKYYSEVDEKKYGVVGIYLKLLDNS